MSRVQETPQLGEWRGDFGREYTDRNCLTPQQVDTLWLKNYGVSSGELNRRFLARIPMNARVLEVGCNLGNQLLLLQELGYSDLHGVDVQSHALDVAKAEAKSVNFVQASSFSLPYQDNFFDLVFTSGVLIHISPRDLPAALDEIHRCAKSYIWGAKYYSPFPAEINHRGHSDLLWKMDYATGYLTRFNDLESVFEQRLPYLENENIDSMFLFRKVPRD